MLLGYCYQHTCKMRDHQKDIKLHNFTCKLLTLLETSEPAPTLLLPRKTSAPTLHCAITRWRPIPVSLKLFSLNTAQLTRIYLYHLSLDHQLRLTNSLVIWPQTNTNHNSFCLLHFTWLMLNASPLKNMELTRDSLLWSISTRFCLESK